MDPLAHTLTGVTLANAGLKQKIGKGCVLALIVASNLVDVDIFGHFFLDQPNWMYRRMWTHSLVMAPLLVLLSAYVFSRLFRQAKFRWWLLAFSLGVAFHIFMDLINSYGVVLFFPLSMERFELAWVFIIDLYIWGILLLTLFGPRIVARVGLNFSTVSIARVGVASLLIYLSVCGLLHQRSLTILQQHAEKSGLNYSFSYVFPEPFGPWRFRGVLRTGDEYHVYLVTPLSSALKFSRTYLTDESDPEIAKLVDSETGETYKWFFKAPVWEKTAAGAALVSDIRFKTLLVERDAPFTYRVEEGAKVGLRP